MAASPRVPTEWPLPRGLMLLVGTAAASLTILGLRTASGIIGPTFLALVLTIAVHPVRGYVTRWRWPGWAGTALGIVTVYMVLLVLTLAMVYAVAKFATLLPHYQKQFNDLVDSSLAELHRLGVNQSQINAAAGSFDVGKGVSAAGRILANLLSVFSDLFFVVTLLLFLAADAGHFPQRLDDQRLGRHAVVTALESFARGTRRYLVVSTVFGLIVAVLDTIFLAFTPVPVPLLWGLLAFITNYIPNIGFIIGLVPPAALALLEGGPGLMLLVIAVYIALNFVVQTVFQPRVAGDAVGLSGTVTFLSLIFWAWVFGPLGALLAVPLTLLAKALMVDADEDAAWLRPLLSGGRERDVDGSVKDGAGSKPRSARPRP
ncbi:MAG: AI-2E family transporter [Nocardioidaceae bacterium]